MSILQLKNVSYTYKNKSEQYILDQVNMGFSKGEFYAILGISGSGKTTLLSLLAGLDTPVGGGVFFEGEDIQKKGSDHHREKNIAIIFQNYNLLDYMTPLENLRLIDPNATEQRLLDVGLSEKEINRNVLQLSGGQQQRVAIARALCSKAPIILADEPTGNLDEGTANDIITILQNSAHIENKCVIVVTHSEILSSKADTILDLKDKRLVKRQAK